MLIAGTALAMSFAAPSLAAADTITVTTNSDTSASQCTLRDAIAAANTADTVGGCNYAAGGSGPDPDTINFSLPLPAEIDLATELPHVTHDLSIVGPGTSQLNIHRTSGNFRLLTITPDSVAGTDLVSGLTLSNGNLTDSVGAGISNQFGDLTLDHVAVTANNAAANSPGGTSGQGGGIFNNLDGTLHLIASSVTNNHVTVSGAGNLVKGAGIDNEGTMTIADSTIASNIATATASGAGLAVAEGGGIYTTDATITRSTISDNDASANADTGNPIAGGGGIDFDGSSLNLSLSTLGSNTVFAGRSNPGYLDVQGGGIDINGAGATLTGDTIAFNFAPNGFSDNLASAVAQPDSPVVRDTIISNPIQIDNCGFPAGGSLTSAGYNLEDDATGSCLFGASHDLALGTDPLLNPNLGFNGGPTPDYALQTGSPAIEAGSAFGETTDQRGLPRPSDDLAVPTKAGSDGSDIGAFEVQGQPPPVTTPPAQEVPPTPTPKKKCKKHKKRSAQSAKKKKCKKKKRK
jgi:hypothetical protein